MKPQDMHAYILVFDGDRNLDDILANVAHVIGTYDRKHQFFGHPKFDNLSQDYVPDEVYVGTDGNIAQEAIEWIRGLPGVLCFQ
jgi:hypothetical protein